jgi:hypothetical protein
VALLSRIPLLRHDRDGHDIRSRGRDQPQYHGDRQCGTAGVIRSFALASRTIPMLGFTIVFAQFTSVDACNAVSAANVVCLSLLFHNHDLTPR